MIIVALVATLASSMVWQQWRAIQVEAAERARTQSAWVLSGALDWARLILREDAQDRRHRPSRRALGGAAGRGAAVDLSRRRQGQHRGCAGRVPFGLDHRCQRALQPGQRGARAARSTRSSSPRCSASARPSASRSTSPPASRPACATPRRRLRPTRAASGASARRGHAAARPATPTRRSCPVPRRSWPGWASSPAAVELLSAVRRHPARGDLRSTSTPRRARCCRRGRGPRPGHGRAHRPVAPAGADQVGRRPQGAGARRCRRPASTGSPPAPTSSRSAAACASATSCSSSARWSSGAGSRSRCCSASGSPRATAWAREPVQKCAAILRRRYNRAT